jgi:drug/metabolite transporter (DMT)-like permease
MYKALLIAGLAAVGNAMFVYGQRKSSLNNNSFSYLIGAVLVCAFIVAVVSISYRNEQAISFVADNIVLVGIGGLGMATTYLGFYLLYTNYGAVYYVVYAVLSIITTTVIVGVIILGESFNRYQAIAMVLAILAIVMFTIGKLSHN